MKNETSRGRLLLADDDVAFGTATRKYLRAARFACEVAANADEARQMLGTGEFDLLIADLRMPGNAGLELVEATPQLAPGLPVIILTGAPTVESAAHSVRLPVVAYLIKPPDLAELVSIADHAVANFRVYQAIRSSKDRLGSWVRDLRRLEELMARPPRAKAGPTENYLEQTLGHVLAGLLELKQFTEAIGQAEGRRSAVEEPTLYKAVQETIAVLERTKQSFKSKELGDLRRKLEVLLHAPPPHPPTLRP